MAKNKVTVHSKYGVQAVEIKFFGKPSMETRQQLTDKKFRWSPSNRVWYKVNPAKDEIEFLKQL